MIECKCDYCGKGFKRVLSKIGKRNFCSHKCYIDDRKAQPSKGRAMTKYICDSCGKKFLRYESEYKRTKRHFCSPECFYKYNTSKNHTLFNSVKVTCTNCGEEVEKKLAQKERSEKHFCSKQCHEEYNKGENHGAFRRVECICLCCNKSFLIIPSYITKGKNKFCSFSCSAKYGKSDDSKKRMRESAIKRIERQSFNGKPIIVSMGVHETGMLDKIQSLLNKEVLRQYRIAGYFLDGYCPKLNIAFEIDEKIHKQKERQEKDKKRESIIKKELNCSFIRIAV